MSAVYKVMSQMQKTRPRRIRGNLEAMVVLGGIVIVGILLLVSAVRKSHAPKPQQVARPNPPAMTMAAADHAGFSPDQTLAITVSLNGQDQWVVAEHGVVTEEQLRELLEGKRSSADEQGMSAVLRVRMAADESAQRLKRIYELSEECGMDALLLSTWTQDSEGL